MIEENQIWLICLDTEILQVGEGHHPFGGSIGEAWKRIVKLNVAEVRGGLEKVKQLGQKDPILGNFIKLERCEVRQIPPRQGYGCA